MSEVLVNAPGVASQIDLLSCVGDLEESPLSAISQWVQDVIMLTGLSTGVVREAKSATLNQMLIATMVSSTENYYRTLFADLVNVCPLTARNVATDKIPFAAIRTFPSGKAGFGLVEGVLFSSHGVIAREIKRFTNYQVDRESTLAKAITTFNSVCAIRHAAVHWSGRFDTRAHNDLHLDADGDGHRCIQLDVASIQDALAACDFVVRTTNQVVFDHVLNGWLKGGRLADGVAAPVKQQLAFDLARVFAEDELIEIVCERILDAANPSDPEPY